MSIPALYPMEEATALDCERVLASELLRPVRTGSARWARCAAATAKLGVNGYIDREVNGAGGRAAANGARAAARVNGARPLFLEKEQNATSYSCERPP